MRICALVWALLAASAACAAESPSWATKDLRAGIIGTDNGHAVAFSGAFKGHPEWRIKTVVAYKGGSPDMPFSADRIEGISAKVRENGVEFVDSIEELLKRVDVVHLHSVDGRPHLAQATPVFKAGKRLFIDKPLAATVADAHAIMELSKQTGTPYFSSSTMRFRGNLAQLRDNPGVGKVLKVQMPRGGPGLMNGAYGIHENEMLFTVMGTGCISVTKTEEGYVGKWKDGRLGIVGATKMGDKAPRIQVVGTDGKADYVDSGGVYDALIRATAEFFHTGKPPVEPEVAVEIIEFMVAAQFSRERSGAEVTLEEVRKPPASTYAEPIRIRGKSATKTSPAGSKE
ncbi:MAG: gfo/Idh/MocA family oxidoreductase [Planctomycetes bacterium]|nr:gfo/Idh/MocA family oxidoreductase [Planctomycetota bacterium]